MAVNLACSIEQILSKDSSAPIKIGLMDCDVYGPSVPLLIGASGQPKALGDDLIAPIESYGIKVMSMGLLVDEETPVVWRGPMVMKTIQQFAANVDWGELDLLSNRFTSGHGRCTTFHRSGDATRWSGHRDYPTKSGGRCCPKRCKNV